VSNCDLSQSLLGGVAVRDSAGYGPSSYATIGPIEWLTRQGRSGVNNSHIHDLGGGGIFLYNSDPLATTPDNNFAINNTIHDFSQYYVVYRLVT
jgi:hypothetical protein